MGLFCRGCWFIIGRQFECCALASRGGYQPPRRLTNLLHKIEASKSFATSSGFLYGKIELPMNVRFAVAMGVYAVLALLGSVLLTGKIRDALWILLAGLAVKTLIVMAQRRGGE